MFEKEAEERTKQYMNEYEEKYNCENTKTETDNYNAGLEQGYEEGFQNGAEFGYNKANEWHYVKDGDLPKNNMQVLVRLKNKRLKISVFMENKFTIWNKDYDTYIKLYDVIAWKEIVLPKESK